MPSDTANRKLNILIVEDETMIAMFLADMLIDLGCEVVGPSGTVASAFQSIETCGLALDGALLDVNLRGERSYPIADALLDHGVPFVFVTGYAAHGIEPRFSMIPTVTKPFPFKTLGRIVETFEDHRKLKAAPPLYKLSESSLVRETA